MTRITGLLYVWWVDAKNYTECIRPWYAKALPLPFNYIYPGRFERQAKSYLEVVYGEDLTPKQVEETVSLVIHIFIIHQIVNTYIYYRHMQTHKNVYQCYQKN